MAVYVACATETLVQARKADGYTVVGVEQTSSSVSLPEFGFVPRTVLLLGNEMTGTNHTCLSTVRQWQ